MFFRVLSSGAVLGTVAEGLSPASPAAGGGQANHGSGDAQGWTHRKTPN
jgi:hypothetical protein